MNFPTNLKEARLHKGLSTKEISDLIGVPEATYCSYEAGTDEPDVNILKNICIALDITCDRLIGLS